MDIYLDGIWRFKTDPEGQGVQDQWFSIDWAKGHMDQLMTIRVPSNFNTLKGLDRYLGDVWYFTKLPEMPYRPQSHEYSIEFEAVNYETEVWLNGQFLGSHKGDFLPFRFVFNPRLTSITQDNFLAVKVSNRYDHTGIPPDNYDWYNWGGIHRSVKLLILEKTRVTNIKVTTQLSGGGRHTAEITVKFAIKKPQEFLDRCYAMAIEPEVEWELYYLGRFFQGEQQFNKVLIQTGVQDINPPIPQKLGHISHDTEALQDYFEPVFADQRESDQPVDLMSYVLQSERPQKRGAEPQQRRMVLPEDESSEVTLLTSIQLTLNSPTLWSPQNPELYSIRLHLNGIDEDKVIRFGIREIRVRGVHLIFNGHPIRISGIALHEELVGFGRHYSPAVRRRELIRIKSLGFNAVRTGHYPHDRALVQMADEEGLFLIEEVPIYRNCAFDDPQFMREAVSWLYRLVKRDFNNPSVIFWLVANEIPVMQVSAQRVIKKLMALVKRWDPSRPVSYAGQSFTTDPLRKYCDVVCVNMFVGWTHWSLHQVNLTLNTLFWTQPKKPWLVLEFGAGAKRGAQLKSKKFSEAYQLTFLSHYLHTLNAKPYIAGWCIWCFRDYRSPLRISRYQNGFNRKGIFDENGNPKLFYRYLPAILAKQYLHLSLHRIISPYFRLFGLLPDWLYYGLQNILYFFQRLAIRRYYRKQKANTH